ncbi:MAG: hypothetical protein A3F12_04185 [Gammaproteobacteria bacterium RIFCSPHIGHO2_12_FULL_38_14]|nr:MAG: hypothetical protein A3F12_04185 [Gammaproteobacteria bacterium RIFCSPHIGHO2_12_FULL_38_14]
MLRTHFALSPLAICIFSLFLAPAVYAQDPTTTTTTTVEKTIIVSPAPKSASCTTINAHWEGNVWVDTQTVCKYESRVEGVAWVNDYWACTVAAADGSCTSWELKPGYWMKTYP